MRRTLIIFSLLALSLGAQCKTYRVRNVSALKEAIEQARNGDRIVLRKGIYHLTDTLVVEGKKESPSRDMELSSTEASGSHAGLSKSARKYLVLKPLMDFGILTFPVTRQALWSRKATLIRADLRGRNSMLTMCRCASLNGLTTTGSS